MALSVQDYRAMIPTTSNDNHAEFRTAADRAFKIICAAILDGTLPAGTKLTRRGMADLAGVSVIPVIEALHRLENEGLVESEPHYGSRVIVIDRDVIRDRFALRLAVESQAVRILARRLTDAQESMLRFLATEIDTTLRKDEDGADSAFWDAHVKFHLQIAEFSGCDSFVHALHTLNLFDLLQRSVAEMHTLNMDAPPYHHRRIVDAIVTRDEDHAERVMRDHVFYSGLLSPDDL